MAEKNNINTPESEKTSNRLWSIYWVFVLLAALLIGRIIYLKTIWEPNPKTIHFFVPKKTKSIIKPERGAILDHNGKILAITTPIYDIYMDCTVRKPNYVGKSEEEIKELKEDENKWIEKAKQLATELPEVLSKDGKSARYYANLILSGRNNNSKYALVSKKVDHPTYLRLQELTLYNEGKYAGGLIADTLDPRQYPYEGLARSVIGYVKEQEDINKTRRRGIESKFDYVLHGTPGFEWLRVADHKTKIHDKDSATVAVVNGSDVRSTINIDIQDIADKALRKRLENQNDIDGGCLILMEVETGAIRAMVNLTRGKNGKLGENYNLAIARSGEPGSIIKTATLMTLVEEGKVNLNTKVKTNGGEMEDVKPDQYIKDYENETGRDWITVLDGFKISSNYVFRWLVKEHYGKTPSEYFNKFYSYKIAGRYDFELDGFANGVVPDINSKYYSRTDLIQSAIGYSVQTTPLHMVTFYNGIANKGKMMKPYIVESVERNGKVITEFKPEVLNGALCSKATTETLTKALLTVTTEGTGAKVKNAKCKIAGKTGTAWIALDAKYADNKNNNYIDSEGRKQYQASFVGFFPAEAPKYTAIVTIYSKPTKASIYGGNIPASTIMELADKLYTMDPFWGEKIANEGEIPQMSSESIHVERGADSPVPSVIGLGLRDAIYAIENSGYKCSHSGMGHVVSQTPKAGSQAAKGETVKIVLK